MNDPSKLISLIGHRSDDIPFNFDFKDYAMNAIMPKLKRGENHYFIQSAQKGITIKFNTPDSLNLSLDTKRDGSTIISAIMFVNRKDDILNSLQPFPHNINFYMAQTAARERLGSPYWSIDEDEILRDQWKFNKYKLMLDYSYDSKTIKEIIFRHPNSRP